MTKTLQQGTHSERRVAVWVTQEEAEAFLAILLNAPDSPNVPNDVADDLLIRVAEARREFSRLEHVAAIANGSSRNG